MTMKKKPIKRFCKKCNSEKLLIDFPKNKNKFLGHSHTCRVCTVSQIKDYYRTEQGLLKLIYNSQIRSSMYRKMEKPNYTFNQFVVWMYSNKYKKIFKEWVDAGFIKNKKPSIDRLDDYKSYSLDNIRLVTWDDNFKKAISDKLSGKNKKQWKPVLQLDVSGNLIKSYDSIKQASIATGINQSNISNCCHGKKRYKTIRGFKFVFKGVGNGESSRIDIKTVVGSAVDTVRRVVDQSFKGQANQ